MPKFTADRRLKSGGEHVHAETVGTTQGAGGIGAKEVSFDPGCRRRVGRDRAAAEAADDETANERGRQHGERLAVLAGRAVEHDQRLGVAATERGVGMSARLAEAVHDHRL
jgi:hypothetical protein